MQNSPGRIVIIQSFVFGGIAIEERIVATNQFWRVVGALYGNDPASLTDVINECSRQSQFFTRLKLDFVAQVWRSMLCEMATGV
jgi:hypothetical protein